jgi:cytochrome c-type biogenesis protein CcmH/NrfF
MSGVVILADHSIIDTAPFFLPAFVVVAVLVAVVVRDRRRQRREEQAEADRESAVKTHDAGEGDRAA